MELHENIEPVAFLIGTWAGAGRGHYPTISDFTYTEKITFSAIPGKPFLRYEQVTASPEGQPMHTEVGFLRPQGEHIEFVIAQPTGQTELLEGTFNGSVLDLSTSTVANTSTAKQVDVTSRKYTFDAARENVTCEFGMAAVGEDMQNHLVSELSKQ